MGKLGAFVPGLIMRLCSLLFVVLLWWPASHVLAQSETPPAEVQSRDEAAAGADEPAAGEQKLPSETAIEADERRLAELKAQIERAPEQITAARQALAGLKSAVEVAIPERFKDADIETLERAIDEFSIRLADWQQALGEANDLIIAAQTRPERAQAEISAAQQRLQEIAASLKSGRDGNRILSPERRALLAAEARALETRVRLRAEELAGNSLLQELGNASRELLQERIRRAERDVLLLQSLLNQRRRAQSEQAVAQLALPLEIDVSGGLLARERAVNLRLSGHLLQVTERLNTITQRSLVTRQQLDALTQADRALVEQINALQGSRLLARILYEQSRTLPRFRLDSRLADEIADIRLSQFEVNQQREQIGDVEARVDQLLAGSAEQPVPEGQRGSLRGVLETRAELLEMLNRELNALLNESITLRLNQRQLQSLADLLRVTIEEQMFWVPSNRPLGPAWLQDMPAMLEQQIASIPWGAGVREFGIGLRERPLLFLPLMLLIAGLLWRRRWLYDQLSALHQDIGNVRRDSQWHTPVAVLLNVLLALPGALLLALGGLALQLDARGQNENLGAALMTMALAWLVFYTAYRILSPAGVAEQHFQWPRERVTFLHRKLRSLGLVVLVLVGVVTFAERQPAALADDVIGVLLVLGGFAAMAWLLARMLWRSPASERRSGIRLAVGAALALMPLALIVAVLAGYYFTALKLTDRLIASLAVLIAWRLLEAVFERGLSVAARRLAFQRALAKRQAATREGGDGGDAIEAPTLDMEQVNQQSLRLMRLALLGLFLIAMYWVWADVVSLFTYLDNVTLYEYSVTSGEVVEQVPITLNDLIGALAIAGVSLMLARNIPGLLEVLVLSRMTLAQGSAYATTTLLSYVIAGVGFVATLSTLGVSWDKLQWLVAALSVGLGFGLQEIFANFVSGLIILFERPMRIGDVVTVGELSGTVNKIRIRATTIVDFDRKEIIVPNKNFVTGQLINWSLSDTVTRVTLYLGVGYGSDLDKVRELLLGICAQNARVLEDPQPEVLFLKFGESRLDHELRMHVRELGDRNPALDEINRRIDVLFREHGIEIAFRRMDVHVRSLAGLEHRLGSMLHAAAAPAPTEEGRDARAD